MHIPLQIINLKKWLLLKLNDPHFVSKKRWSSVATQKVSLEFILINENGIYATK